MGIAWESASTRARGARKPKTIVLLARRRHHLPYLHDVRSDTLMRLQTACEQERRCPRRSRSSYAPPSPPPSRRAICRSLTLRTSGSSDPPTRATATGAPRSPCALPSSPVARRARSLTPSSPISPRTPRSSGWRWPVPASSTSTWPQPPRTRSSAPCASRVPTSPARTWAGAPRSRSSSSPRTPWVRSTSAMAAGSPSATLSAASSSTWGTTLSASTT